LAELRLAAWLDDPCQSRAGRGRRRAHIGGRRVENTGARIIDVRPDVALPELVGTYAQLLYPIILAAVPQRRFDDLAALSAALPAEEDGPLAPTARFATLRHRDWFIANERHERLRAVMADYFRDVDALLMPVTVAPAIPHDHSEPFADQVIAQATPPVRTPTCSAGLPWRRRQIFPPPSSRSGARPRGYRWDSKSSGLTSKTAPRSRWPAASRSYSVVSSHRRVREPAR
jgi:Asp-tRNA(Asn)/Glu-tRNA(Gln) amidotransferase A subunit family amidase